MRNDAQMTGMSSEWFNMVVSLLKRQQIIKSFRVHSFHSRLILTRMSSSEIELKLELQKKGEWCSNVRNVHVWRQMLHAHCASHSDALTLTYLRWCTEVDRLTLMHWRWCIDGYRLTDALPVIQWRGPTRQRVHGIVLNQNFWLGTFSIYLIIEDQ